MVADIFYPIFTLKITVLACFIQEKQKNLGASSPPGHLPGPPGGLTAPPTPPYPQLQKKTMRPYFFWIIPGQLKRAIKITKICIVMLHSF